MSRYVEMFSRLQRAGEAAFIPFMMLGDPDPERSLALADLLIANGADALEFGIPFSDPIADGPVIQRAALRALAAGTTPARCLELLHCIRQRHPTIPIGLLVYANLVVHQDLAGFYHGIAHAGADSVLVADVPAIEAEPFAEAALAAGIEPVLIIPPDASRETVRRVAQLGRGYSYLLGRVGVTGAERAVEPPDPALLAMLRQEGAPPPVVGFGISTPAHVRAVARSGAAGAISGSAVVRIMEAGGDPGSFVREMKRAAAPDSPP